MTPSGEPAPSDSGVAGDATDGGSPNAGVIVGAILGALAGLVRPFAEQRGFRR